MATITDTSSIPSMLGNSKDMMLNKSMATSFRVHCMGSMYMVGNAQYDTASAALQAYIDKFEGRTRPTTANSHNDLYDLFIMKNPPNKSTTSVEKNMKMKEKELRLQKLKVDIEQAYISFQTALRKAEADDAFRKSQQVLQRVEDDALTSADQSPSDVGSMGTDQLITVDPYAGYRGKRQQNYSYKALRSRSNTMDSMQRPRRLTQITEDNERILTSSDRVLSRSPSRDHDDSRQLTHDTIMSMDPAHDRLADKLRRIRSRSMSPSTGHSPSNHGSDRRGPPSWIQDLDSSTHPVPSWVNGLETTQTTIGDNHFEKGRPPPSWISDVGKSDITSGVSSDNKLYHPQTMGRHQNLTDSNPPGLSFTDLIDTPKRYKSGNRVRHHSDGLQSPARRYNDTENDTKALNLRNFEMPDDITHRERLLETSRLSKSLDTSLNRSLPDDLPVPDGLRDILEKYLDPASRSANTSLIDSPLARRSRSQERLPRSSSLDTLALLTGQAEPKSEITGASTIPKDGDKTDYGSASKSGQHHMSPHRSDNRSHSPVTDHVLDGDRPWEQGLPNFKSSYRESHDRGASHPNDQANLPTFTGSQQPGSMEALKNMLFKLQQETPPTDISVNLGSDEAVAGVQSPPSKYSPVRSHEVMSEMLATDLNIPALKGYNFQAEPGGQSLERALLHLSRLKNLVTVSDQDLPKIPYQNQDDDR